MLPVNPVFYADNENSRQSATISDTNIKILEDTSALSIPEKVNVLALLLGHKWITDIAIDWQDKAAAMSAIEQLSLPHENNYYEYDGERHTWLQVAANKAILEYVVQRRDSLTVLEAGVLYGYPVSHSLGYVGMLEKEMKGNSKNIAEFYLSGVFSKAYSMRETAYFEQVWEDVAARSDRIAQEAQTYYLENK